MAADTIQEWIAERDYRRRLRLAALNEAREQAGLPPLDMSVEEIYAGMPALPRSRPPPTPMPWPPVRDPVPVHATTLRIFLLAVAAFFAGLALGITR